MFQAAGAANVSAEPPIMTEAALALSDQSSQAIPPTPAMQVVAAPNQAAPAVLAVVEMNLEEYPAFRLGRRSKRPELHYVRTRNEADGRVFRQTWTVRGAEGFGLPGPFEQDLYVALLVLFTEQGLPPDGRIRFTRNRLAQVMGVSNSGRGYELIEQGLSRLAGATVQTEHAFFRPAPQGKDGERSGPAERLSITFHILEEVRVYERRAALEDAETSDDERGQGQRERRIEPARPMELSVARLGQPLVQSYERRYTKGLDATFYFSLTRPLGKRLYRYLDKVRNGRGSFEIGLRALADVLGLEYRYPSDIKDGLVEAHAELQSAGYLAAAAYAPLAGGPAAGEKVVYGLDPAFDRRPRRRAGAALTSPPAPLPQGEGSVETQPTRARKERSTPKTTLQTSGDAGSWEMRQQESDQHSPLPLGEGKGVRSTPTAELPEDGSAVLRRELEAFGITPARARALVEAYDETQIREQMAYVRRLMERPASAAGGSRGRGTIKNPAGLLARAIEQGYVVQDTPADSEAAIAPRTRGDAGPSTPQRPDFRAVARGLVPRLNTSSSATEAPTEPRSNPTERQPITTPPSTAPAEALQPTSTETEAAIDHPLWASLATALKERLSPATYAAWIALAQPQPAADGGTAVAGEPAALTLLLPNAFTLDRWHRPPIAPALKEAAAALGLAVKLEIATARPPG
jgi:hypothetical protein